MVDPRDPMLIDRTGKRTVATTDPISKTIFLSKELKGDFLRRVFIHELGHCTMISFGLIDDIHRMVEEDQWIPVEEWICNFLADYGQSAYAIASKFMGDHALLYLPNELERLVS